MKRFLLGCLVVLLGASIVWAQGTVPVQSSPTELRASQLCVDTRTTSGAATVTVPAVSGQSFYINSVETNGFATGGATGVLTPPGHVSSTGIIGSPTFGAFPGVSLPNGTSIANFFYSFSGNGLKGQPSTAVVLTAPSTTNVGYHMSICGYYAP